MPPKPPKKLLLPLAKLPRRLATLLLLPLATLPRTPATPLLPLAKKPKKLAKRPKRLPAKKPRKSKSHLRRDQGGLLRGLALFCVQAGYRLRMRSMGGFGLFAMGFAAACFSEPTNIDGSGDSGGTSAASTTGVTIATAAPTASATTTTVGGTTEDSEDSETRDTGTTVAPETSSGTTESSDASTTEDPPPETFCDAQLTDGAIACEDFDAAAAKGWTELPAVEIQRDILMMNPLSPPGFVRSTVVPLNEIGPRQALYEATPPALASSGAFEVSFAVRLPPDVPGDCDTPQLRVAEIQYNDGAFVNVVVEFGPEGLRAYYSQPAGTTPLFAGLPIPSLSNNWHRVRLQLLRDVSGAYTLRIEDDSTMFTAYELENFAPPGGQVSTNVGPWFDVDAAPSPGCSYDLDNLVLRTLDP